ncbi:MAG: phytoene desaturase family protein [Verrucomicrobiales bacterium]|nr:phytoene desaturase family protein [Verrucomicrobiales bacterium]
MEQFRNQRKVIIVGAGPGGLASAMLLASKGVYVEVFERLPKVGGRTSHIKKDGFTFDTGPTFFLYPQLLEEIFRDCGASLEDEVKMVRLDPQYRLFFEGGPSLDATPNLDQMEKEVAKISVEDAAQVKAFMKENEWKFEKLRPVLQKPFNSLKDFVSPSMFSALPAVRPWASLDDDLKRFFKDPRTRLAFSFQSKYLGMSPYRCPSLFSILSGLEYQHGVFHPIGGCAAVSEAMARVAKRMGVKFHLEEPVEELVFDGRRVTGIKTKSGQHNADALFINADFARAMSRLVPDHLLSRWTKKEVKDKQFSCSTFMLYLGIDGIYKDLPHHTIVMAEDYKTNLDDIENNHQLSGSPSYYVQNACVTDPSLAPEGQSTLYILLPVTHQHENVDWNKEAKRYREVALDRLSLIGLGDIRERIVSETMLTPDDWDSKYEIHRGAVFNLAHNIGQLLHNRPRNRFEELDGVYLTGGGTHPGSGLPVIYESARISSNLALRDLAVL